MQIATIAPTLPFLDTLAARWLADSGAESGVESGAEAGSGLILLPTRRAVRALGEAFLRVSDGKPLLLPRIAAIGGLDDESLLLGPTFGDAALALPPAVDPVRRLAVLARLIIARDAAAGVDLAPDLAWQMAAELARLLDDAQRAEIDLAQALGAAGGESFAAKFAEHWQKTLDFLQIITGFWPDWLAGQGLMDPVARQMRALRLRAEAWTAHPPRGRVIAAGITVTNPASEALLATVARLPQGLVLLPGLDLALSEADWDALDEVHPQADLRRLLEALGARRDDVAVWNGPLPHAAPPGRAALLGRVMLPATGLGDWLADPRAVEIGGLSRLSPVDAEEEAQAIALAMRDALETPGRRVALVTPDRALATRVVTALSRWAVHVEDSVGEPLVSTPPAVLLRLLLGAVERRLAPVALLALLKHPLTTLGLEPIECRQLARQLERACLRGPRPAPGIAGLRAQLAVTRDEAALTPLIDRLETCLAPLLRLESGTLPELLTALIQTAEAVSANAPVPLWSGEEGAALSEAVAALIAEGDVLPPLRRDALGRFFDAALAPHMVRTRRALRGRGARAEHPRLFIWGLLEARLQTADQIILAGLGEGVWPGATDPGPWLSRPMRAELGLDSPERAVGAAAADFVRAACGAPEVVFSAARRREGAPLVPSRWLVRLDAFLQGRSQKLPIHPALDWARALDRPLDGRAVPVDPPRPIPPLSRRPRQLSVTAIDTLKSDPYAIHARHILRLKKLDGLEEAADRADYGTVVHAGLARVFGDARLMDRLTASAAPPAALEEALFAALDAALLENARVTPALAAWWRPRLLRIAAFAAETDRAWRAEFGIARTLVECKGRVEFTPEGAIGPFVLTGVADRIDLGADGRLALLDYKTGTVPNGKDVTEGWMSQLPLEAAMALRGGFDGLSATGVAAMAYWKLAGGFDPGKETRLQEDPEALADAAWAGLEQLVVEYDDPARPYLSHPRPGREPRYADYRQLARHGEWSAAADEEGE